MRETLENVQVSIISLRKTTKLHSKVLVVEASLQRESAGMRRRQERLRARGEQEFLESMRMPRFSK